MGGHGQVSSTGGRTCVRGKQQGSAVFAILYGCTRHGSAYPVPPVINCGQGRGAPYLKRIRFSPIHRAEQRVPNPQGEQCPRSRQCSLRALARTLSGPSFVPEYSHSALTHLARSSSLPRTIHTGSVNSHGPVNKARTSCFQYNKCA